MNCDLCEVPMKPGKATAEKPYRYVRSGLDNVLLVGIDTFTCPKCGAVSPVIPRMIDLHAKIAEAIAWKPALLTGPEMRFLRKHAGLSGVDFARFVGVSSEHVSRFETGKQPELSKPADRMARLVALTANGGELERGAIRRLADSLAKDQPTKRLSFTHKGHRWSAAA